MTIFNFTGKKRLDPLMSTNILHRPEHLKRIAISIRDNIFGKIWQYKRNIFLCGGSTENKNSMRLQLEQFFKYYERKYYNIT